MCVADKPCGPNAACTPNRKRPTKKYVCECIEGHGGNPYSDGRDQCRPEEKIYLENLFGVFKCRGCPVAQAIPSVFRTRTFERVLDLGAGGCEVVKTLRSFGINAYGVESNRFPLEENCPELLTQESKNITVMQQAPLDKLPFEDDFFDLVFVSHVLEYIPRDALNKVLAEISRVAKMNVIVTLTVPDLEEGNADGTVDGVELQTLFPYTWWHERIGAHGMSRMVLREELMKGALAEQNHALPATEGLFILGVLPPEDSHDWAMIERSHCYACEYMPLVLSMYSNIHGAVKVAQRKSTIAHSLVVSPSICNVISGLLEHPPSELKRVYGFHPSTYALERDCPDLSLEGHVAPLPADGLLFGDSTLDLAMSLFQVETMESEAAVKAHVAELMRVSKRAVVITVHTCGSRVESTDCLARQIPGARMFKPRSWWLDTFKGVGLVEDAMDHIFNQQECGNKGGKIRMCESRFETLKHEGSFMLDWKNVFAMKVPETFAAPRVSISDAIRASKGREKKSEDTEFELGWLDGDGVGALGQGKDKGKGGRDPYKRVSGEPNHKKGQKIMKQEAKRARRPAPDGQVDSLHLRGYDVGATNVNVPQKPHLHGKKKFLQPEATGPQFATSGTGNRYDPAAHNAHMEQLKAKIKQDFWDSYEAESKAHTIDTANSYEELRASIMAHHGAKDGKYIMEQLGHLDGTTIDKFLDKHKITLDQLVESVSEEIIPGSSKRHDAYSEEVVKGVKRKFKHDKYRDRIFEPKGEPERPANPVGEDQPDVHKHHSIKHLERKFGKLKPGA